MSRKPRRLFIGSELPAAICRAVLAASKQLSAAALSLSPVRADNLHLTLRFIGDVAEEDLDGLFGLFESLDPQKAGACLMALTGYGHFSGRGGLTVWAGITPSPALTAFVRDCETGLRLLGFAPERRPWTPHVTLARRVEFSGRPDYRSFPLLETPLPPRRIVLWQSRFTPDGVVYETLAEKVICP